MAGGPRRAKLRCVLRVPTAAHRAESPRKRRQHGAVRRWTRCTGLPEGAGVLPNRGVAARNVASEGTGNGASGIGETGRNGTELAVEGMVVDERERERVSEAR